MSTGSRQSLPESDRCWWELLSSLSPLVQTSSPKSSALLSYQWGTVAQVKLCGQPVSGKVQDTRPSSLKKKKKLIACLFILAVLGLRCFLAFFLVVASGGCSLVSACRLLVAAAPLWGIGSWARAQKLWCTGFAGLSMWDLPMSPALAGRFLSSEPPGGPGLSFYALLWVLLPAFASDSFHLFSWRPQVGILMALPKQENWAGSNNPAG